jgi:hypothetical protein
MRLIRKVEWKGLKQLFEVEWRLVDVSLQLPRWIEIDLGEKARVTLSHVEEEEEEYWVTRHWYKDAIDQVEDDTKKIIEAVREAARQAREKEAIAEQLTGVFLIEVD